jgi:hypothetical protein
MFEQIKNKSNLKEIIIIALAWLFAIAMLMGLCFKIKYLLNL